MKIAFCSTICDVSPVFILFYFPETGKPIQNTHFKLPRMDTIVAFNKRITKVIYGEMLQLRKSTIIEVQIIWITCTIDQDQKAI